MRTRFRRAAHVALAFAVASVGLVSGPISFVQAAPGDLDPTFGSGGKVVSNLSGSDSIEGLAIQPDGKLVAVGGDNVDVIIARYTTAGLLDSTFGTGGKVVTDFAGGPDAAHAVALQPDGKIVVAGFASVSPGVSDYAIVRYLANGTPDSSFGSGGKVTVDCGGSTDEAFAIALQADGKVVIAGFGRPAGNGDFCLVRLTSSGALDGSFGSGGLVSTPFGGDELAFGLAIQPDGKIVAAGNGGPGNDFTMARYQSNGTLDSGFGSGGLVTTDFGGFDQARWILLPSDGTIVLVGGAASNDIGLARYQANGSLDPTFGVGGTLVVDAGSSEIARAGALQADGKIVAVAERGSGPFDFVVVRVTSAGALDASFGTGGIVTTDFGGGIGEVTAAVAIQADGKIVAGGGRIDAPFVNDFALARYLIGAAPLVLSAARDGFLRSGSDNTNEGANPLLRIQSSGSNRALVAFDLTGVSLTGLTNATLILTIAENADNWGATGRPVEVRRLLADWTEGNGKNADLPSGQQFRGTGAGVTWNCAIDTDIANSQANCSPQWNGGTFAAATAPAVVHTNGLIGEVSWNVTADVLAGASFGWVVKRQQEGQSGQVLYYSREGATAAGNPALAPRLVLTYGS